MGAAKYLLKKALTKGKETLEDELEKLEDDPEAYFDEKLQEGESLVNDVTEQTEELLDEYARDAGYADLEEARQEYGLSDPEVELRDELPDDVDGEAYDVFDLELVELEEDAQDTGRDQLERKVDAYLRTEGKDEEYAFAVAQNPEDNPVKVEFYREAG
ncbi:MAG: hypothetical protein SVU32_05570 [Candidatus Nanohaloarchaea archaeon]|nr:hypothetical protein [Candidatus Nanohaloarchaea archaeon]